MTITLASHTYIFTHREALCIALLELDWWIVVGWFLVKRHHRKHAKGGEAREPQLHQQ